jgi:hypothetical protein
MIAGEVTKEDVCFLTNVCGWGYRKYHTYKVLFEGFDGRKPNYGNIAPVTLGDLAKALKEHLILEVCKLTDPMKDHRGNVNLSIRFFAECANLDDSSRKLAQQVGERLEAFGKKLRPARDKILSHFDRTTVHVGEPLGEASEEEWATYWCDLEQFVQILSERYLGEVPPIRDATSTSDAAILRGVLEERAASHVPLPMPRHSD